MQEHFTRVAHTHSIGHVPAPASGSPDLLVVPPTASQPWRTFVTVGPALRAIFARGLGKALRDIAEQLRKGTFPG